MIVSIPYQSYYKPQETAKMTGAESNHEANRWLAEQLDKGEATISKWCTNRAQPSLETLVEIAKVLQVDTKDLLWSIKEE